VGQEKSTALQEQHGDSNHQTPARAVHVSRSQLVAIGRLPEIDVANVTSVVVREVGIPVRVPMPVPVKCRPRTRSLAPVHCRSWRYDRAPQQQSLIPVKGR